MTDPMDPPSLFGWGRGGVPGEFRAWVAGHALEARRDRGDDSSIDGFAPEGVERIARKMLDQLRSDKLLFIGKGHRPKLTHEMASVLYLLHAYCSYWKQPAPPALLLLTFESLDLQEEHPSADLAETLDTDTKVEAGNVSVFLDAAKLDGEADAAERKWSLRALAKKVGTSEKSLRRWRQSPVYQRRRAFCGFIASNG